MKPILDLREDVKRKAVTRLTFENLHQHEDITRPTGRFYRNPEGYAMEKYHYYQCFKCKKVNSRAPDKRGLEDNSKIIFFIS